jgi:hypothetical protein
MDGIGVRAVFQEKFDEIFFLAPGSQPFIVPRTHKKPLRGGHHGVHLRVP